MRWVRTTEKLIKEGKIRDALHHLEKHLFDDEDRLTILMLHNQLSVIDDGTYETDFNFVIRNKIVHTILLTAHEKEAELYPANSQPQHLLDKQDIDQKIIKEAAAFEELHKSQEKGNQISEIELQKKKIIERVNRLSLISKWALRLAGIGFFQGLFHMLVIRRQLQEYQSWENEFEEIVIEVPADHESSSELEIEEETIQIKIYRKRSDMSASQSQVIHENQVHQIHDMIHTSESLNERINDSIEDNDWDFDLGALD